MAAGLFLALILSLVGFAAKSGIQHGKDTPEFDSNAKVAEQIMEAVKLGQGGEYAPAAKLLGDIVKHHPKNTDAMFNLGVALSALERYKDAERIFERVNQLSPNDFDAVAERAGIRLALDDAEGALALLEKVPVGAANMANRLGQDPRWVPLKDNPRMAALLQKHGVAALAEGAKDPSSNAKKPIGETQP
jgi:tetratricopeptide (TPR) repeat protein